MTTEDSSEGDPMKEDLTKAVHDLAFARVSLVAALHQAGATKGLVLLPMIGKVTKLHDEAEALLLAIADKG